MIEKQTVIVPPYLIDEFGRSTLEQAAAKLGLDLRYVLALPVPEKSTWRGRLAARLYALADWLVRDE